MTIIFITAEDFFDGCAAMVSRGIKFNANFETFTIVCTGGF